MSVQIWERIRDDIPDLDDRLERGEFGPLREWLGEHIHRHGRKFLPQETLERAVGARIDPEPYLALPAREARRRGSRLGGPRSLRGRSLVDDDRSSRRGCPEHRLEVGVDRLREPTSRAPFSDISQRCSSSSWKSCAACRFVHLWSAHDRRLEHLRQPASRGAASETGCSPCSSTASRKSSMSSSSRRAWFSCASRPVSRAAGAGGGPGRRLRPDPQPIAAVDRLELELVDVEAPLVQPVEPFRQSSRVTDRELLLSRQLLPEPLVLASTSARARPDHRARALRPPPRGRAARP